MINSVDEAVEEIKKLFINYSDEKLKEVLLFYFKELRKHICPTHSPTPETDCKFCHEEQLRLEAIRGIASAFEEMNKLAGSK